MPKVSVIIPVFNPDRQFLTEALESVFAQTFQDLEVIIVDDGSRVDVAGMLAPWAGRLRVFRQDNRGANPSRKLGLAQAQGDLIALLDQDDLWGRDKIERQVRFLSACPDLDLVFSDFQNFNAQGPIGPSYFSQGNPIHRIRFEEVPAAGPRCRVFTSPVMYDYLRGNFIAQCTLMARREACERFRIFDNHPACREFYEFATQSLHRLRLGYINEVLMRRRVHGQNLTFRQEPYWQGTIQICESAQAYPWMDERCRAFLRQSVVEAYRQLGKYYLVKGRSAEARSALAQSYQRQPRAATAALYGLSWIVPPGLILGCKKAFKPRLQGVCDE